VCCRGTGWNYCRYYGSLIHIFRIWRSWNLNWVKRRNFNGREKWVAAVPTITTFVWRNIQLHSLYYLFIHLIMGKRKRNVTRFRAKRQWKVLRLFHTDTSLHLQSSCHGGKSGLWVRVQAQCFSTLPVGICLLGSGSRASSKAQSLVQVPDFFFCARFITLLTRLYPCYSKFFSSISFKRSYPCENFRVHGF
jgi:hypothetical protein